MTLIEAENEYSDVEGGMRDYLRVYGPVVAIVGQRSFFGVPRTPTWPLVTIGLAGDGSEETSDAPIVHVLLQIDCWGELNADGLGLKAGATALVNAVRSAVERLNHHAFRTDHCLLHGGGVESALWLPDPDNDRPHYSVTAEVTATLP